MAMKDRAKKLAEELGIELESKHSWVREVGKTKWRHHKQMYYHLHGRLSRMKKRREMDK